MTVRHVRRLSVATLLAFWFAVPAAVAQIDPQTAFLEKAAWDALEAGQARGAAEGFRAALAADPMKLPAMAAGAKTAGVLDAADRLADLVLKVANVVPAAR